MKSKTGFRFVQVVLDKMNCDYCLKGKIKVYKCRYAKKYYTRYVKCTNCGKNYKQIVLSMVQFNELKYLLMFRDNVKKDFKLSFGCGIQDV